jgi:hypothetical protein
MKTQSVNAFSLVSKASMDQLTTTVQETLAKEFLSNKPKTFSSADLWNIQRNRRTIVIR